MNRIHFRHLAIVAITLTTLNLTEAAFAQYAWIDDRGIKQYSDMPPPSSVPDSRILKKRGSSATSSSAASNTSNTTPATPELSLAEKDAEFRKRKMEQAEKEKKANEEAIRAADKAKHCERTREYNRVLESGERIARTDKNGERSFLTDEQRAQEIRESRRTLNDCK